MGAAAAMSTAALELVGLRRTFGDVVALDALTFSVPAGTLFGFVGRNGAGKTTTMRIVCGLLAADDGSVTWHGEAIGRVLGTHVQRLATIAHGDGVCTTCIPTSIKPPSIKPTSTIKEQA